MANNQKKNNKNQAYLGAGLAAGGLGLYGASKGVLSADDYNNLSAFKNLSANNWTQGQDPRENMRQYSEYAHRAISAHPFGINGPELMGQIRNPTLTSGIAKILGMTGFKSQGDWVKSQSLDNNGLTHYTEFAKSPLDGYRQMSAEYTHGYHAPSNGTAANLKALINSSAFTKPSEDKINQYIDWNKAAINPATIGAGGIEKQKNSIRQLMSDTQSKYSLPFMHNTPTDFSHNAKAGDAYMHKLNDMINNSASDQHLNLASASVDQKRQIYNNLDSYVKNKDIGFWKQKQFSDYSMGTMMPHAGPIYSNLISPFTGAHDAMGYFGLGTAAAGVGIGGYGLYKLLKSHLNKKKAIQTTAPVQTY